MIIRKIEIKQPKKRNNYKALLSLTQKCVKRSVTPLTVSYVAQGGQQTTKALTYRPVDNS